MSHCNHKRRCHRHDDGEERVPLGLVEFLHWRERADAIHRELHATLVHAAQVARSCDNCCIDFESFCLLQSYAQTHMFVVNEDLLVLSRTLLKIARIRDVSTRARCAAPPHAATPQDMGLGIAATSIARLVACYREATGAPAIVTPEERVARILGAQEDAPAHE